MPTPNEDRLTNVLVHQIPQIQLLSHRKSLRHHGQAAGRADIDSPSLRRVPFASFFPFNRHGNARIYALTRTQLFHPQFETLFTSARHTSLINTNSFPAVTNPVVAF